MQIIHAHSVFFETAQASGKSRYFEGLTEMREGQNEQWLPPLYQVKPRWGRTSARVKGASNIDKKFRAERSLF